MAGGFFTRSQNHVVRCILCAPCYHARDGWLTPPFSIYPPSYGCEICRHWEKVEPYDSASLVPPTPVSLLYPSRIQAAHPPAVVARQSALAPRSAQSVKPRTDFFSPESTAASTPPVEVACFCLLFLVVGLSACRHRVFPSVSLAYSFFSHVAISLSVGKQSVNPLVR